MLQALTFGLLLTASSWSQSAYPGITRNDDPLETLRRQIAFREFENRRSEIERQIALRRNAQYLESQFISKVNRFVQSWRTLVEEYNDKKVFNLKMAGEVSKAFHDLETSDGWPKRNRK